ncbi:hypothetical protein RUM44_001553 [Polyplax serrata]|uniref:Peroxisomal targeting signal 1 receptor n=1 Tax=Polyplax serrata TaxID=468196 RepID=A0ABR1AKC1_POLSC
MSFHNLLEGDCGGQNPLIKLGSHFTQDQSFRQDRVHPLTPDFTQADLLVQEFLEDNLSQNVQTFRMDELFREMRDIESNSSRSPLNQAPNVAQLATNLEGNIQAVDQSSIWAQEFIGDGVEASQGPTAVGAPFAENLSVPMYEQSMVIPKLDPAEIGSEDELKPVQGNLKDLSQTWGLEFEKMKTFDESQFGLGKDWVESFLKSGETADVKPAPEEREGGSSKFIKFMKTGKVDEEEKATSEKWTEEFTGKELDETQLNNIWGEGLENLPAEDGDYSNQFWKKLQTEWEKMSKTEGDSSWEKEYSDFIDPFKEYKFDAENPMKESENPFESGLKKLEENDLPSAVLFFEAAAQADPENPLVWQYLGTTQAENEQDPRAIAALKKCISLQGDNLTALMSLAISYTNENYQNQACQVLKQWLQNNPKYSDLVKDTATGNLYHISSILSSNIHNEVRDMYIAAANKCPSGEIDVDVQCGLGVLFNLSNEIDKAVDCFKAALQARPKDFRMWNRLGATLANGQRSEEAVDAYYNALHLSPGFIRARYNLGITCVNLGANREAAEHLLTALNQQAKGRNTQGDVGVMSESIWSTLRMVVGLLGKPELQAAVEARDLPMLSKEFNVK